MRKTYANEECFRGQDQGRWVPPRTADELVRLDFANFLSLLSLIIFIKKCNKVEKLCKCQFHKKLNIFPRLLQTFS